MSADKDLLFGLLALQNGLIEQDQLLAAFRVWSRDRNRPMAEHLVARGDIDADRHQAVDAMLDLHLRMHGGDAEKSLAKLPTGPSTREKLAALADPDLNRTIARIGKDLGSTEPDPDRTATYEVHSTGPPAGGSGSSGRTPGAGWGRCSSRSTTS